MLGLSYDSRAYNHCGCHTIRLLLANKLGGFSLSYKALPRSIILIVNTPAIWFGVHLFFISFILWIKVLIKSELSYAYPMVSPGYIIVVILQKVIGILVIIAGVVIINK
jgi:hypothetical protein